MISMWTLYWLNVMFSFSDILIAVTFVSLVLFALGIIGKVVDDDIGQFFSNHLKMAIAIFIVSSVLQVLIPSKKEALAIYMIPKVVNNEQVQQLPENALKYLNLLFKKEMEEIQKEMGK